MDADAVFDSGKKRACRAIGDDTVWMRSPTIVWFRFLVKVLLGGKTQLKCNDSEGRPCRCSRVMYGAERHRDDEALLAAGDSESGRRR